MTRFYNLILLLLCSTSSLFAQLRADFQPSQAGGCSPLMMQFTNTSSGAGPSATYEWDFGNGNRSALRDAGSLYIDIKSYTVTLTVRDGNNSSTVTKEIVVYPSPVADFKVENYKVCIPDQAIFTSTSTTAFGNISSYYWDYGDGQTEQGYTASQGHAYGFPQEPSVSLTVTNNFGCHATVKKDKVVKVLPAIQMVFSADQQVLCKVSDPVKFSNSSTGPGSLSYAWEFGDGNKSTLKEPSHVFNKKGIYTVSLKATSSEGCTVTQTLTDYLNVASYSSDFDLPAEICQDNSLEIVARGTPNPSSSNWYMNGQLISSWGPNIWQYFPDVEKRTYKLVNFFGNCPDTVEKSLIVKPRPRVDGFLNELQNFCGAPATVKFKDTTSTAVSWGWDFTNNYTEDITDTKQETSKIFDYDGWHYTRLKVTNKEGCSSFVEKFSIIERPYVQISVVSSSSSGEQLSSCEPFKIKFTAAGTYEIASYKWNFGDGGTSTDTEPEYAFNKKGNYIVSLEYVFKNGCKGSTTYPSPVRYLGPAEADFKVLTPGQVVCGQTPVQIQSQTSPGSFNEGYNWIVNDIYLGYSSNFYYQFSDTGKYTIKLIAYNGGCSDTITKVDYLDVRLPFPRIQQVQNSCEDDHGLVTFTQDTKGGLSWEWDFGDGTKQAMSSNTSQTTHRYKKTGTYKVVLSSTNGICTVKDSTTVLVMLKQKPQLSSTITQVCPDGIVPFTISGIEKNPYFTHRYGYITRFEFEDGSPFNGAILDNYDYSYLTSMPYNNRLSGFPEGKENLRVIISQEYFNCPDTSNFLNLRVLGTTPVFTIESDKKCYTEPVIFKDATITSGTQVTSWEWDFGDGAKEVKTSGGTVSHLYNEPGTYYARLTVKDGSGCASSSQYYSKEVIVKGPKASFNASASDVHLNSTIWFYNSTNASHTGNVGYSWDLGDGTQSNDYYPVHTYTKAGNYKVVLVAKDLETGCTSSWAQTITVRDFNYGFTMNTGFVTASGCPPVVAQFYNTSLNYTRMVWDFGDGSTLQDVVHPRHVYEKPGKYFIVLNVYGHNGLEGTFRDSITIGVPMPAFEAAAKELCPAQPMQLRSTAGNYANYTWDFGDGSISRTAADSGTHPYMTPGSYTPRLLVTDSNGCKAAVTLKDPIIIRPLPQIILTPVNPQICAGSQVQLQATGGVSYNWSPASGLSNASVPNPVAKPGVTTTYTLIVKDAIGCSAEARQIITVVQPSTMQVSADQVICAGESVSLVASGMNNYQWIGTVAGLSNTVIANPVANPGTSTTYTVIGADKEKCFSDTALINVTVNPLPNVDAGEGGVVLAGNPVTLLPTGSADIVSWDWAPARDLNCTNCQSPTSTPRQETTYTVSVRNAAGCIASDTITLKLRCAAEGAAIPNAFTPNSDGRNDLFVIQGVSFVKHLVIYNRWGAKVFERSNFIPSDRASCWDGTVNGKPAPGETYVYAVELECEPGKSFPRKGSLVLIR
ncbi:PKD domain-containing protein [Flavihumibacter sediminis]|nr:PKD domain-containing protein [Flavihumibacter sediminis]